jgi:hypothetical protein
VTAHDSLGYDGLGLRRMPPLSARRHPTALPGLLIDLVDFGQRALAEPFRGITSDGSIRPDLFPLLARGPSTRPVVEAGAAFLETLTTTQRAAVTLPIDSDAWRRWCNVHIYLMRHGLLLEDLDQRQREGALGLIRACTSARGFDNHRNVMRLNEHLAEITESPDEYGEWAYFISIFGTPSDDQPWGWQLDGHHLNVHCFMLGDQMVMTPAFLGAEPCHAKSGRYAGTRMFDDELRDGLSVVRSLTPDQAGKAVVYGSTMTADLPPDRVALIDGRMSASAFQDNRRLDYEGLRADEMTDGQRRLLCDLVETYVGSIRDDHAVVRMAEVERHLDETHFCWMGATDDVGPIYYKVQSPVILIEFDHLPGVVFDNEEPTRHHVHTIVRTPNGNDYGADLLRQHYERSHHSPAQLGATQHAG